MKSLKHYLKESDLGEYDERAAIAELSKMPQPIVVNGGSYGYRCDVTKRPLTWIASDGSVLTNADSLAEISKWMDDPKDWLDYLDGQVDLSELIEWGIVRKFKPRGNRPWGDQEDHEMRNQGLISDSFEPPNDSASPISGASAQYQPDISEPNIIKEQDMDAGALFEKYLEMNKMWNMEGMGGVRKFQQLIREVGGYQGLEYFLEDNPGAIGAMMEFIEQWVPRNREWQENLQSMVGGEGNPDDEDEIPAGYSESVELSDIKRLSGL